MVGIFNPRPWRSLPRGTSGGEGKYEGCGGVDGGDLVSMAGGSWIWPEQYWQPWCSSIGTGRKNEKEREGEDCWPGYGFVEQASEEWVCGGCSWQGRGAAAGPHHHVLATV